MLQNSYEPREGFQETSLFALFGVKIKTGASLQPGIEGGGNSRGVGKV